MSQLGSVAGILGNPALTFQNVYNNALTANSNLYNNIQTGYSNLLNQQQGAYNALQGGYSDLQGQVMGTIAGVNASQLQAAKDLYTQQQGATQQHAISAGLGNSTVLASLSRGNTLDYAKATTAIENQFAQLRAGYQSQLGLAGLNAQQQGIAAQTALGAQGLAAQGQFAVPYPGIPGGLGGGGGGGYGGVTGSPSSPWDFDPNWGKQFAINTNAPLNIDDSVSLPKPPMAPNPYAVGNYDLWAAQPQPYGTYNDSPQQLDLGGGSVGYGDEYY